MIPEFDENGNLPPGVHFCDDWEELKERFGYTTKRAQMILGMEDAMSSLKAGLTQLAQCDRHSIVYMYLNCQNVFHQLLQLLLELVAKSIMYCVVQNL